MRRFLACSILGAAVGVLVLGPARASATSCLPTLGPLQPADGEELPVNARPLAPVSCGGDLTGWEVEIDGEPGALFLQSPGFGYGMLTSIGIDPPPPEGALVELWGCSQGCWDASVERDVVRSYAVGAEDRTIPAAPVLLELSFEDDLVSQWSFETGQDELVAVHRWTVHVEPPSDESPVAWEVEVGPRHGSSSKIARPMGEADAEVVLTRYESDAGQEVCAVARAVDLSGNASAVREICVQVGEDQTLPEVPGGEGEDDGEEPPADDGADDGAADDGFPPADSEGAALDQVGGGCSISGRRDGAGGGLAVLLGLLGLRLRRGRRLRPAATGPGCGRGPAPARVRPRAAR